MKQLQVLGVMRALLVAGMSVAEEDQGGQAHRKNVSAGRFGMRQFGWRELFAHRERTGGGKHDHAGRATLPPDFAKCGGGRNRRCWCRLCQTRLRLQERGFAQEVSAGGNVECRVRFRREWQTSPTQ